MTSDKLIKADNAYRLEKACRNFARALEAVSSRQESTVISNKGKTLLTINRTRQNTVKMTVGK